MRTGVGASLKRGSPSRLARQSGLQPFARLRALFLAKGGYRADFRILRYTVPPASGALLLAGGTVPRWGGTV